MKISALDHHTLRITHSLTHKLTDLILYEDSFGLIQASPVWSGIHRKKGIDSPLPPSQTGSPCIYLSMDPTTAIDDVVPDSTDFANLPTHLSEDKAIYEIHILDTALSADSAVRERLRAIQTASTQLVKRLLAGYIWQRDGFRLDLVREKGPFPLSQFCIIPTHTEFIGRSWLRGQTSYGDAVEDEWLVVYLLRQLSSQFPEAWIRVTDSDGEFFLAEAANVLPKWLNPDVAENRVSDSAKAWLLG